MSRQIAGIRLNKTDLYPTPPWCYENLDINWKAFSDAHEPCRGDGRIQEFIKDQGISCSYTEILEGKDFFEFNDKIDLIVTNPPFSLAKEFIEHSIALSNTVIMLLRLNFLGSIKRRSWWIDNTPTSLYILSKRPSFTGKGTDATDYAWFICDKTNRIDKGIKFVPIPSAEQMRISKELSEVI